MVPAGTNNRRPITAARTASANQALALRLFIAPSAHSDMADELAAERPRAAAGGLGLLGRLEQLDGVAVGVFQLDLLAAGTLLDLVPEAETGLLQRLDAGRQVIDFEDDPVPPARLLLAAIGHRAGAGTFRPAQPEGETPVRDG